MTESNRTDDGPAIGLGTPEASSVDRRRSEVAVDVLMPVYNAAATIESAVASICAQTLKDLHIVIVDDGSSDGTAAILARLAGADERIEVITTANRGIVDALNTGLEHCSAEFIARHDADDLSFPERLQKQVAFLRTNPAYAAISCNVYHIGIDGRRLGYETHFPFDTVGDPYYAPSAEPYLMHPFLMVRRAAIEAVGGYRYAFHCEDTDLYWRLTNLGRLAHLPETLGEYRMHAASISSSSVLNGRISALNSQLSALSERRRRDGKPDISFARERLAQYHAAQTLDGLIDIGKAMLSEDEWNYLEIAVAAKMIELSGYRPYRLTREDLLTIRRLLNKHYEHLAVQNRRNMVFRLILRRARLIRRPLELALLVPWTLLPKASLELAVFLLRSRLS